MFHSKQANWFIEEPDLIDFCLVKILQEKTSISACYDLSSDYSALVVNLSTDVLPSHQSVYNKSTNWETFREILECSHVTNVP